MIRLILVRHGNTFEEGQIPIQIGARTDLPLTAYGRKQAEWMAEYLISNGIVPKAIYAGELKRQTESAQIIAKRLSVKMMGQKALTEIDYGLWEGLTSEEIASRWPKEETAWKEAGQWPESIFAGTRQAYWDGIENWLELLRKTYSGGDVIVGITSNGLLRFFKNEKVKTGHFCEFMLFKDNLKIKSWNSNPSLQNA